MALRHNSVRKCINTRPKILTRVTLKGLEGDKGGGGGFGSRFMRGKTAISHFTGKKLVISRNSMNSFLSV